MVASKGSEFPVSQQWRMHHETPVSSHYDIIKWKHFRVTVSLCGEFTGEFPSQRPVTRSFDVFLDLRPNKRLSEQSQGWWFETPSCPLWRHCNERKMSPTIWLLDGGCTNFHYRGFDQWWDHLGQWNESLIPSEMPFIVNHSANLKMNSVSGHYTDNGRHG